MSTHLKLTASLNRKTENVKNKCRQKQEKKNQRKAAQKAYQDLEKFRKVPRVMTNAHCVAYVDGNTVMVKRPGAHSKKYAAKIDFVSQQADLALLKVADEEFFDVDDGVIEFADSVQLDEELVVRGYPRGMLSINYVLVGHFRF